MRRTIFTDEHYLFRESVQEFCRRHVVPKIDRWREERWTGREIWKEAGRQDFIGLAMPTTFGGAELDDFRFNQVLGEELAAASLAVNSALCLDVDVVAPYLLELTTAEQKERYVPDFCAGRLITSIGMTEPQAGSNLAALRTRAVRDGDGRILNGAKTFITNGTAADLVALAARTGEGARTSASSSSTATPKASAAAAGWRRSASTRPTPPSSSSRTSACRPGRCSARRTAASTT